MNQPVTKSDITPYIDLSSAVDKFAMANDLIEQGIEQTNHYLEIMSPSRSDAGHLTLIRDSRDRIQTAQHDFEGAAKAIENEV